jgi:hypothetical protein
VDYDELTTLQDYLGTLVEPDINPTDVTKYDDVYQMLSAQTAAALFDIDDTTSLRVARDGSGGVPVEGDPVGIMMDVSGTGGLTMEAYLDGATELVTNGTFDTDTTGWANTTNAVISVVSQEMEVESTTGGQGGYQDITTEAGKVYQLSWNYTAGTATGVEVRLGNGASFANDLGGNTDPSLGTQVFTALSASTRVYFRNGVVGTSYWDNVSVKALPGYTAVAASDAARPTLRTYDSPITSRDVLTTTYSWTITDGGRA